MRLRYDTEGPMVITMFENRLLKKMYGLVKDNLNVGWEGIKSEKY